MALLGGHDRPPQPPLGAAGPALTSSGNAAPHPRTGAPAALIWLLRLGPLPNYVGGLLPGQLFTGAGVALARPSGLRWLW
jgi:hypothetical protein